MKNIESNTIVFGIATFIIYIMFFFLFDKPIDTYININLSGSFVENISRIISLGANSSYYKLGLSISFILIIVLYIGKWNSKWTSYLLYICLSISIAMIVGDGLKYLLGRYRPIMLFTEGYYGLSFFGTSWELNSSPSGHTLRAFSFAMALSMLFKRYSFIFIFIALLIGISRIVVTAHYPSDVIFGAYIGIFSALWTYKIYWNCKSST